MVHNNLRSIVSRFKLISLLCMIYMYAMRFIAVRKYKHYISVPSQAEKRALLYGSPVKNFIMKYMSEYDEHLALTDF